MGKAYFVKDNGAQDEVNNALTSCLDFLPSVRTEDKTEILTQETFKNVYKVLQNVYIDEFAGKSVSVQIDYVVQGEVSVYNPFDGNSTTISGSGVITFTTPQAEPGLYEIKILDDEDRGTILISFVTLLVKSKAPDNVLPIVMACWTNVGAEDVILSEDGAKLVIYSKATQGMSPVIYADASASITSDNNAFALSLKDDGVSPDTVKNDGIYSAYFTDFKPNQAETRYSLVCQVTGTDETKVVDLAAISSASFSSSPSASSSTSSTSSASSSNPRCCGSNAVTADTPLKRTGPFTRTKAGGAIKVGPTPADINIFPPGPIRDLKVGDLNKDRFSFSFTSPGADLNTGNISQFIIFYSENKTDLNDALDPSSSVARVSEDHLACTWWGSGCNLDPLPPQSKVELSLGLKHFQVDQQVFFRVLAEDEGGKTSLSNRASILLARFNSAPAIRGTFHLFLILTSMLFVFNFLL